MQVFTGGLLVLHFLIICRNLTTQEFLGKKENGKNFNFRSGACGRVSRLLFCLKGRKKEYSLISNDFVRVSRTLETVKT